MWRVEVLLASLLLLFYCYDAEGSGGGGGGGGGNVVKHHVKKSSKPGNRSSLVTATGTKRHSLPDTTGTKRQSLPDWDVHFTNSPLLTNDVDSLTQGPDVDDMKALRKAMVGFQNLNNINKVEPDSVAYQNLNKIEPESAFTINPVHQLTKQLSYHSRKFVRPTPQKEEDDDSEEDDDDDDDSPNSGDSKSKKRTHREKREVLRSLVAGSGIGRSSKVVNTGMKKAAGIQEILLKSPAVSTKIAKSKKPVNPLMPNPQPPSELIKAYPTEQHLAKDMKTKALGLLANADIENTNANLLHIGGVGGPTVAEAGVHPVAEAGIPPVAAAGIHPVAAAGVHAAAGSGVHAVAHPTFVQSHEPVITNFAAAPAGKPILANVTSPGKTAAQFSPDTTKDGAVHVHESVDGDAGAGKHTTKHIHLVVPQRNVDSLIEEERQSRLNDQMLRNQRKPYGLPWFNGDQARQEEAEREANKGENGGAGQKIIGNGNAGHSNSPATSNEVFQDNGLTDMNIMKEGDKQATAMATENGQTASEQNVANTAMATHNGGMHSNSNKQTPSLGYVNISATENTDENGVSVPTTTSDSHEVSMATNGNQGDVTMAMSGNHGNENIDTEGISDGEVRSGKPGPSDQNPNKQNKNKSSEKVTKHDTKADLNKAAQSVIKNSNQKLKTGGEKGESNKEQYNDITPDETKGTQSNDKSAKPKEADNDKNSETEGKQEGKKANEGNEKENPEKAAENVKENNTVQNKKEGPAAGDKANSAAGEENTNENAAGSEVAEKGKENLSSENSNDQAKQSLEEENVDKNVLKQLPGVKALKEAKDDNVYVDKTAKTQNEEGKDGSNLTTEQGQGAAANERKNDGSNLKSEQGQGAATNEEGKDGNNPTTEQPQGGATNEGEKNKNNLKSEQGQGAATNEEGKDANKPAVEQNQGGATNEGEKNNDNLKSEQGEGAATNEKGKNGNNLTTEQGQGGATTNEEEKNEKDFKSKQGQGGATNEEGKDGNNIAPEQNQDGSTHGSNKGGKGAGKKGAGNEVAGSVGGDNGKVSFTNEDSGGNAGDVSEKNREELEANSGEGGPNNENNNSDSGNYADNGKTSKGNGESQGSSNGDSNSSSGQDELSKTVRGTSTSKDFDANGKFVPNSGKTNSNLKNYGVTGKGNSVKGGNSIADKGKEYDAGIENPVSNGTSDADAEGNLYSNGYYGNLANGKPGMNKVEAVHDKDASSVNKLKGQTQAAQSPASFSSGKLSTAVNEKEEGRKNGAEIDKSKGGILKNVGGSPIKPFSKPDIQSSFKAAPLTSNQEKLKQYSNAEIAKSAGKNNDGQKEDGKMDQSVKTDNDGATGLSKEGSNEKNEEGGKGKEAEENQETKDDKKATSFTGSNENDKNQEKEGNQEKGGSADDAKPTKNEKEDGSKEGKALNSSENLLAGTSSNEKKYQKQEEDKSDGKSEDASQASSGKENDASESKENAMENTKNNENSANNESKEKAEEDMINNKNNENEDSNNNDNNNQNKASDSDNAGPNEWTNEAAKMAQKNAKAKLNTTATAAAAAATTPTSNSNDTKANSSLSTMSDEDLEKSSKVVLKQLKELQSLAQSTNPDPKKIDVNALHPGTVKILKKLGEVHEKRKSGKQGGRDVRGEKRGRGPIRNSRSGVYKKFPIRCIKRDSATTCT